jgi:hypothetical protein
LKLYNSGCGICAWTEYPQSDDLQNANDSIRVKCEFDSNVIDESDSQYEKQFDPRISTFIGIKIDRSDEHENASDSFRVKCQFDSNEIDKSNLQNEEQFDPTISIFIPISISDDCEKFRINLCWRTSIRKPFSRTKTLFPDSIAIDDRVTQ